MADGFLISAAHDDRLMNHQGALVKTYARPFPALVLVAATVAILIVLPTPGLEKNQTTGTEVTPRIETKTVPFFEGMGPHARKVATTSAEAQRYFDQGLTWAFAFNHDEAIRSFEQAAKLDPACAMAYWGKALSLGPHINNPVMDEPASVAAWTALQQALALARAENSKITPIERELIEALASRYADPAAGKLPLTREERKPWDEAYAAAMKKVFAAHAKDADVATLYAESLMDLYPWDLYEPATHDPRPRTAEIVSTLEHAMKLDAKHPGANHLYIHAVEASPDPERAIAAANVLRTLVPASGHLVHMPAHIDVRTGGWALAAEQNRQASKIDNAYREISPQQGIYRIYMAHNDHFLAWSCMMLGRREEALTAARDMLRKIPVDFMQAAAPFVDPLASIELTVLMRFGLWDEILATPQPADYLPITSALWRFARGSALAAQGKVAEALVEQSAFRKAVAALPAKAMLQQNPASAGLAIADATLAGEIAFRQGRIDNAVKSLITAVNQEDALRYMEPPDWLQPARHSLGAILLSANRFAEAEAVYRADLKRWPENGWALYGLMRSLAAQQSPEVDTIRARFEKAWAQADIEIDATCLCVSDSSDVLQR